MSPVPPLAQAPPATDDHPLARARRHHRLLMHELVVRAGVAVITLVFAAVDTTLGFAVNSLIRVAALGGLLINGHWLLISRTGRGTPALACGRLLTDTALLPVGL